MPNPNYDNPDVEERWCSEQRSLVTDFLKSQGVNHGRVGEWPAWYVAPHVLIWAVESLARPDWIGWWAICGDLPTDYISVSEVQPPQNPRNAVRAIVQRWLSMAQAWGKGKEFQGIQIAGSHSHVELAPVLKSRAKLLLDWTIDDSIWETE